MAAPQRRASVKGNFTVIVMIFVSFHFLQNKIEIQIRDTDEDFIEKVIQKLSQSKDRQSINFHNSKSEFPNFQFRKIEIYIFYNFARLQFLSKSFPMKIIILLTVLLLAILPAESTFSPELALHFGYLSGAAYEPVATVESWTCLYCKKYLIESPKLFSNLLGGIQGYTGYARDLNAIVVVFRGSINIQNWIINFNGTQETYPLCTNCSVHSGFYKGYNLVAATVRSAVAALKLKYPLAKLYVTGHSLGGALASICTADLGNVDLTYTFGEPRVGNSAYAKWFQSKFTNFYRVVHYADVVPHVAPMSMGYTHSNIEVWYQKGMTSYVTCAPQSSSCANSLTFPTIYSLDDHMIDRYITLYPVQSGWLTFVRYCEEAALDLTENLRKILDPNEWASGELSGVNNLFGSLGGTSTFK